MARPTQEGRPQLLPASKQAAQLVLSVIDTAPRLLERVGMDTSIRSTRAHRTRMTEDWNFIVCVLWKGGGDDGDAMPTRARTHIPGHRYCCLLAMLSPVALRKRSVTLLLSSSSSSSATRPPRVSLLQHKQPAHDEAAATAAGWKRKRKRNKTSNSDNDKRDRCGAGLSSRSRPSPSFPPAGRHATRPSLPGRA